MKPAQNIFSKTIITVALQVGCLTLILIVASLIVGLFLDRNLDTLPLFTILFLVGSMPVSWLLVFKVVNKAKNKIIIESEMQIADPKLEDDNSD